tara:strand:+ start:944 stop:1510 length:567 start_codon:yes stop_codon:yes gene_type:complete
MFSFKSKNKYKDITPEIYQNIIERSRSKFFYLNLDIDDSFESRFDIIILHSFIIFYFLKNISKNEKTLSQFLFDFMFNDFDNNLREMGFGDIAVNKKMKVFITAFYGRITNYSKGVDLIQKYNDDKILKQALLNNIYKGKELNSQYVNFFKQYIIKNLDFFNSRDLKTNINERFRFIDFPLEEYCIEK